MQKIISRLLMAALLLLSSFAHAQSGARPEVESLTKITVLSPGLSYEGRIARNQSWRAHAFAALSFGFSYSSNFGTDIDFDLYPGAGLQYRYYYNGAKRAAKGKRTERNNMNYLAGFSQVTFSRALATDNGFEVRPESLRPTTALGVVWGMQRNYPKHFSLDLSVGPGYYFTRAHYNYNGTSVVKENISGFTLLGELSLGFWLNRRNNR